MSFIEDSKEKKLYQYICIIQREEASSSTKEFDLLLVVFIIVIFTHLELCICFLVTLATCKGSFYEPRKPKVFSGKHENY